MRLAVLTYDHPHRRTQDLLLRLKVWGYQSVTVVATPWEERKPRFTQYPQRPGDPGWPASAISSMPAVSAALQYPYLRVPKDALVSELCSDRYDLVVIGGAGLLPKELVDEIYCLNVHPGYLPYARGLDSLKWAFLFNWPIGATAHVVNEEMDGGHLILQEQIPIYASDTFASIAHRQYETEMGLFEPALRTLSARRIGLPELPRLRTDIPVPSRRFSPEAEASLPEVVRQYVLRHALPCE